MWDFLFFPIKSAFTFAGLLVGVILFAFWIWMIIDCAKRKFRNSIEKIIWLLVVIFLTWLGALVYFIAIALANKRGITK